MSMNVRMPQPKKEKKKEKRFSQAQTLPTKRPQSIGIDICKKRTTNTHSLSVTPLGASIDLVSHSVYIHSLQYSQGPLYEKLTRYTPEFKFIGDRLKPAQSFPATILLRSLDFK